MSIVKMHNKKTGITYVYESESYWDKEKQQPRNRRKLIGKIDPETGEIVPTGGPGRKPRSATMVAEQHDAPEGSGHEDLKAIIDRQDREISELKKKVKGLEIQCAQKDQALRNIRSIVMGIGE